MQPERPVQTTLAFHASRIVIDVGVLLAMAAMSMRFVNAPDGGRSALAADAFPAVVLLLPVFAVTLIPDHTRPLHPIAGWGAMVLALAALPYSFVKLLDAGVLAQSLGGSVGFGAILLVIGCLVAAVGVGIGVVRDILGHPSGGSTQRRSPIAAAPRPAARTAPAAGRQPVAAPAQGSTAGPATTRVPANPTTVPANRPAPAAQPSAPETPRTTAQPVPPSRVTPPAARNVPTAQPVPDRPRAPAEITFPDQSVVAREADPERRVDDPMSTAERADAALDDHLLAMFDPPQDGDDEA